MWMTPKQAPARVKIVFKRGVNDRKSSEHEFNAPK